jgi:hypothetical protein
MSNWPEDKGGDGFDTQIGFAVDMIFNELGIDRYLYKKRDISEVIKVYLKSTIEAKCLLKLADLMDNLLKDVFKVKSIYTDTGTDEEYITSLYLSSMRDAAKECFLIFIENEKDNKEFCNFILNNIKRRKEFSLNPDKSAYENIITYAKSIKEF